MLKDMSNLIDVLERVAEKRYSVLGLFLEIIVALILVKFILLASIDNPIITFSCYALAVIIISIIWYYDRKPQKVRSGKIGFIVCISCREKDDRLKIKEDFIDSLRKLVKRGNVGDSFDFIFIPQFIAEKISDSEAAYELKNKCGAHYMIWGSVRNRVVNGEDRYVIDLDGIVSHHPAPEKMSRKLSIEFAELLPRKMIISKENDFLSFELTSEIIELASKYIIGIAAHISGDLDYSYSLFSEADQLTKKQNNKSPQHKKISSRLPLRFAEISLSKSRRTLALWSYTQDPKYIEEMGSCLDEIDPTVVNFPQYYITLSVYHFLYNRNIKAAFDALKKYPNRDIMVVHLNLAFLSAYEGDLKRASREYKFASKCEPDHEALSSVEDFICQILKQEPEKYQLHYCLGIINWLIKGDKELALKDFRNFIKSATDSKFSKEIEISKAHIEQINSQLHA